MIEPRGFYWRKAYPLYKLQNRSERGPKARPRVCTRTNLCSLQEIKLDSKGRYITESLVSHSFLRIRAHLSDFLFHLRDLLGALRFLGLGERCAQTLQLIMSCPHHYGTFFLLDRHFVPSLLPHLLFLVLLASRQQKRRKPTAKERKEL